MKPWDLILTLVDACSGRDEFGRTSLQKMAYFAGRLLGFELGHHAHYYGPYSELVDEDVASLVLAGLVEEEMTVIGRGSRGPVRRYGYSLTDDGVQRLEQVRQRHPDQVAQVHGLVDRVVDVAGSLDQGLLSQAAKTIFVAEASSDAVDFDELRRVAAEFNWQLDDSQRERVQRLMEALTGDPAATRAASTPSPQ